MNKLAASNINTGVVAEVVIRRIGVKAHHIAALQVRNLFDLGEILIITLSICAVFNPYSRLLVAVVHKARAIKSGGRGGIGGITLAQLVLRHIYGMLQLHFIGVRAAVLRNLRLESGGHLGTAVVRNHVIIRNHDSAVLNIGLLFGEVILMNISGNGTGLVLHKVLAAAASGQICYRTGCHSAHLSIGRGRTLVHGRLFAGIALYAVILIEDNILPADIAGIAFVIDLAP